MCRRLRSQRTDVVLGHSVSVAWASESAGRNLCFILCGNETNSRRVHVEEIKKLAQQLSFHLFCFEMTSNTFLAFAYRFTDTMWRADQTITPIIWTDASLSSYRVSRARLTCVLPPCQRELISHATICWRRSLQSATWKSEERRRESGSVL